MEEKFNEKHWKSRERERENKTKKILTVAMTTVKRIEYFLAMRLPRAQYFICGTHFFVALMFTSKILTSNETINAKNEAFSFCSRCNFATMFGMYFVKWSFDKEKPQVSTLCIFFKCVAAVAVAVAAAVNKNKSIMSTLATAETHKPEGCHILLFGN